MRIRSALAGMSIGLVLWSCAGTAHEIPTESRLIVAVAGVEGESSQSPASGTWDDLLVTELLKTRRVRVIERSRLDALLAENELTLSAIGDAESAPRMLKAIGADAILFAQVTGVREYSGRVDDATTGWWSDVSLGIEATVSARLVSVSSGEILAASTATGKAESGQFSGAMGLSTVDKGRDELVGDAVSQTVIALARDIARKAPARE